LTLIRTTMAYWTLIRTTMSY